MSRHRKVAHLRQRAANKTFANGSSSGRWPIVIPPSNVVSDIEFAKQKMNVCVFSGYWNVPNNHKRTNHIPSVEGKPYIDYFFGAEPIDSPATHVPLTYDELPAHGMVPNLKNLESRGYLYDKEAVRADAKAFVMLSNIWLSKILLFDHVRKIAPDFDYYMWADCVMNINTESLLYSSGDISLNNYGYMQRNLKSPTGYWSRANGGIFEPSYMVLTGNIKIKADILDDFLIGYKKCLSFHNDNKTIYDDETVLTYFLYTKKLKIHDLKKDSYQPSTALRNKSYPQAFYL